MSDDLLTTPDLDVVLFSGGRGGSTLVRQLATHPRVSLTVAINGYDDGASTGEVRRWLGDCLGPSDFRKSAVRLARERRSAPEPLLDLLDARFPATASTEDARALFGAIRGGMAVPATLPELGSFVDRIDSQSRTAVADRLDVFAAALDQSRRPFRFADCNLGNLVFAGGFLQCGRSFNAAVDDHVALVGLQPGAIENVTDGANAYLVALDVDGRVLGSEGEIVDAKRRNRIRDIYLISTPLTPDDCDRLAGAPRDTVERFFAERTVDARLNPRLETRLRQAGFIVYAPGTQHSSLFPSYLTRGLSEALARNLSATKLLITNIQADAEITGSSAVEIIERAVYYLKEKGRRSIPTPCLITHYLLNDPRVTDDETLYVPLGPIDALEDPRLVRIGSYEDGVSGRHDGARVLQPFIESLVPRCRRRRIAVVLYDGGSLNKITQSILEMVRGGLQGLPLDVTVFYDFDPSLERTFVDSLPFRVCNLAGHEPGGGDARLREVLRQEDFDYVVLFESSGMYRGEDVLGLLAQLQHAELDAVWGSRRLSVRDIQASYRLRYRHNLVIGAVSYIGSHLLSLAYLLVYGRYVSDTLSAVRVVRVADALVVPVALTHRQVNPHLLTGLLRRKAELLELPVRFFPLSPERVRRTTVWEGTQALGLILWRRLKAPRLKGKAPQSSEAAVRLDSHVEPHRKA